MNLQEFYEKFVEEAKDGDNPHRLVIDCNDGRFFMVNSAMIDEDGDLVLTAGEEL